MKKRSVPRSQTRLTELQRRNAELVKENGELLLNNKHIMERAGRLSQQQTDLMAKLDAQKRLHEISIKGMHDQVVSARIQRDDAFKKLTHGQRVETRNDTAVVVLSAPKRKGLIAWLTARLAR